MSPTAELIYGYPIKWGEIPERISIEMHSVIEEKYGFGGRYALAAWLLLDADPEAEVESWGDPVTDLEEKTGIWIDAYGYEDFFVTMKHLRHSQVDHGYRGIHLVEATDTDKELMARYAVGVLDTTNKRGWYLVADSH